MAGVLTSCASSAGDASPPTIPEPLTASPTTYPYGDSPEQFATLALPSTPGPHPVVVLIHGGFWRSAYGLDLMDPLAADLVRRGYAAWNIEYRRVGQPGGGWPGTLEDVAAAIDELAHVAEVADLDLTRVSVVGHSAGGHLALWAAGRGSLDRGAPGADPAVDVAAAVGLAPVTNLRMGADAGLGGGAVVDFLGGTPAEYLDRYAAAEPNLAGDAAYAVIEGDADDIVPEQFARPDRVGDVTFVLIPGADHFDVIDPTHDAWTAAVAELAS
jgi:acetyl esterase/lipase